MTQPYNPYRELPDELYDHLVHARHQKPTASTGNGTCVAVASANGYVSVQDTKLAPEERQARTQVYTSAEWAALIEDAKAGRYDHLI